MPARDCLIYEITLAKHAIAQLEGKYSLVQIGGSKQEQREALVQLHQARLCCDDLQLALDTYDTQQESVRQDAARLATQI